MTGKNTNTRLLDVSTDKNPNSFVLLDAEDYERVSRWKWHLDHNGYARRHYRDTGRSVKVAMHRFIIGAKPGEMVDHINGNPRDNRKANLRICSNRENQQNRNANAGRPFKGVYKHSKVGKWEAAVGNNGKRIYLGLYDSPTKAAVAYDVAATMLFGKYAKTNLDSVPGMVDLVGAWAEKNDPILTQYAVDDEWHSALKPPREAVSAHLAGNEVNGFQDTSPALKPSSDADSSGNKGQKKDRRGHNLVTVRGLPKKTIEKMRNSPLSDYYWANRLGISERDISELRHPYTGERR